MLVINTNNHPVPVKVDTPTGSDTVHIAAKGRVKLPAGVKVNTNWLATEGSGIKVDQPVTAPKIPLTSTSTKSGSSDTYTQPKGN